MATPSTNFGFQLDGTEDIRRALKQLGTSTAQKYMREAIKGVVEFIKSELLDSVPVRTGKMRKAIAAGKYASTAGDARGYVWIKKKGGYQAHLIEYGHRIVVKNKFGKKVIKGFQPANPFFRPVIDNNVNNMMAIFQYQLKNIISRGGI